MGRYNWTQKRKVALECLIQAGGNVRLAAEVGKGQVSEAYVHILKYHDEHIPFREEFYRRTGQILNALEVTTDYIITGLYKLSQGGYKIPAAVQRQTLRDLGDYLGIWAPEKRELSIEVIYRIKELGLDAEEVIAEAERIVRDAYRRSGDLAGD